MEQVGRQVVGCMRRAAPSNPVPNIEPPPKPPSRAASANIPVRHVAHTFGPHKFVEVSVDAHVRGAHRLLSELAYWMPNHARAEPCKWCATHKAEEEERRRGERMKTKRKRARPVMQ
jgi:hypothetical protein